MHRRGPTRARWRKRGLAVDVLGLIVAVVVIAASAHDNTAGIALLEAIDACEALTREVEQTQSHTDELTATLGELQEALTHLRITRTPPALPG